MQRISPSGIREAFQLALQIEGAVDLSLGQPHFAPPRPIVDAVQRALEAGCNRYSQTKGDPGICRHVLERVGAGRGYRPEDAILTCGVSGALLLAVVSLVDPGDEILVPDPYFVMYRQMCTIAGAVPAYYDTYPDFRIRREALEMASSERTRAIIVNTPANPTGAVVSAEELETVARFARQRDLVILADEIYDAFVYEPPFASVAPLAPERTLLMSGLSKTCSVPGWRIGYAVGPRRFIEQMNTLQMFSFVCAPTPAQRALAVAFDVDLTPWIDEYRARRDRVVATLSGSYQLVAPGGAFYAFVRSPRGTGTEFCRRALDRKLIVIPGATFSRSDTHLRISYAVEEEVLGRGLEILLDLAGS